MDEESNEDDGDIEMVSVQILKKPSVAQQSLCVLKTLKFVQEKIPTNFQHFCIFVQKFFSFTIDNVVLETAWSTLNRCSTVAKPVSSLLPGETVVIDSDIEDDRDHESNQITLYVGNKICKEGTKEKPKLDSGKEIKPKIEPLNDIGKRDVLKIIKKHFSPSETENRNSSSPSSSSESNKSFETPISGKRVNKLILKKLKKLKQDKKCQIDITPKKKKKRKSMPNEVTYIQEDRIDQSVCGTKRQRSTGGNKRKSFSRKSEEEEADELRMDLFINKLIEISLPSIINDERRKTL